MYIFRNARIVGLIFSLILIFISNFNPASAQLNNWGNNLQSSGDSSKLYNTKGDAGEELAVHIGGLLAWTTLMALPLMIQLVLAGYEWMTASGDKEKANKAKARIKFALIGTIILIMLYLIAFFFIEKFANITGYKTIDYGKDYQEN